MFKYISCSMIIFFLAIIVTLVSDFKVKCILLQEKNRRTLQTARNYKLENIIICKYTKDGLPNVYYIQLLR